MLLWYFQSQECNLNTALKLYDKINESIQIYIIMTFQLLYLYTVEI